MPSPSPFRAVPSQPDFPAQEHEILALWKDRQAFARLRARLAGGKPWSFLDGPITANNPMGVHHAWGRTYKDLYQRYHAMLGEDQRFQNGFDCQGLWVEVNVERELGFKSKRDIERYGIAEFVTQCKQRVLTYAARQTEQSVRLGMWMDWNDPDELRRLRDLLAEDPAQEVTIEGPNGPVTDTVEMIVGRLGMPDTGGSYFTFSNENNDLIWGFLAECHRRGWLYKGHDTMPWCARCGTGMTQQEVGEGYQDRADPGLTVAFPLLERPGEALLVWTTTPWTLTSNVAAAVGPDLRYVKVRQGERVYWLGKGTLKQALDGRFEVLEEVPGREMVGWTYQGPFDDLPVVQQAFGADADAPYVHSVVPWTDVGEEEGTGIVHIAPGCGTEDFHLGRSLGLPVIAPLDESGIYVEGFDWLTGRDVQGVADPIVEHLRETGFFYRLETIHHRYPHCWRCGTPLVFRLVDEWYISMGPVYDVPRDQLTADQKERSLRYQIMDVVDRIRWIPGFGHDRELDWLLNMHDWMISKKRYWGLALPIYPCARCGEISVVGGREELRERAVAGWADFEHHTPHRPWIDDVLIACGKCGNHVQRIRDVGNPWLDAGIVPFSTLHYREDREYWERWFPADFITESFPGQFRNWFYSLLAMSTVLRGEEPFRTILGYASVLGGDGRQMHKSWGNAIDFDDAAERMGVDVIRWLFARHRPEENILFGYDAADEARRELLVLWNVYAFFATYAGVADWRAAPLGDGARRPAMDRWIASRTARLAAEVGAALDETDTRTATRRIATYVEELSTWYLRRSRKRFSRNEDPVDREQAFTTLHASLVGLARVMAPVLPFLAERLYQGLVVEAGLAATDPTTSEAIDSVHLTTWPAAELAADRDDVLESAMSTLLRAVELGRMLRGQQGIRVRQPLARLWLALPGGVLASSSDGTPIAAEDQEALLALLADELNVKSVELMGDESELVERRVKPLLPVIGRRYGSQIPAIMAAARANEVEYLPEGSVRLGGVTLEPSEVEILASPRPGTAVAHDEGLVVVVDTTISDELRAEGDARELQRAIQDLRKEAGMALDGRIELWLESADGELSRLEPHLDAVSAETLATLVRGAPPDAPAASGTVELERGSVRVALRPAQTLG